MHKLLFASASVLALGIASTALAAGSSTYIVQTGSGEQAAIDQTGASQGQIGTEAHPFIQQGGSNSLTILQGGTNNSIQGINQWLPQPPANGEYVGQSGTGNQLTVVQTGRNGTITSLQ